MAILIILVSMEQLTMYTAGAGSGDAGQTLNPLWMSEPYLVFPQPPARQTCWYRRSSIPLSECEKWWPGMASHQRPPKANFLKWPECQALHGNYRVRGCPNGPGCGRFVLL